LGRVCYTESLSLSNTCYSVRSWAKKRPCGVMNTLEKTMGEIRLTLLCMPRSSAAVETGGTLAHMVVGVRLLARCSSWGRVVKNHRLGISDCVPGSAKVGSTGYRHSFGDCSCPRGIFHVDPFCLIEGTRYEGWIGILTEQRVH